jgi:CHAT domain-containing protein/tetratricopeptide (TPR) repeat protein
MLKQIMKKVQQQLQAIEPTIKFYEWLVRQEQPPIDYAINQHDLGIAYWKQAAGERDANLRRAIDSFKEALQYFTLDTTPFLYADTQTELGDVYGDLQTEEREANLKQAIAHYQQALRFFAPGTMPLEYAYVQRALGYVYEDLSHLQTRCRESDLSQAIAYYKEALRFQTVEANTLEHARLETGRVGIVAMSRVLKRLHRQYEVQASALEQARLKRRLGVAYGNLPKGEHGENLDLAINCFQEALRSLTPEAHPLEYARTLSQLAKVYLQLPTGNREAHLAQAMTCCQEALRFLVPETSPLDYGDTQSNLGIIYMSLIDGNHTTNLQQAISAFREALRFWTPETNPLGYARTQLNLGSVYSQLSTGNHAANLKYNLSCYREALRFLTPETSPQEYACVQYNMGSLYLQIPGDNLIINLEQAIPCYQEALRFLTPDTTPFEYASVQSNLGFAYRSLPLEKHAANLERALACYQEVLHIWTPQVSPPDYARTLNNLGDIYRQLPIGDHNANLAQAIACFQEALNALEPVNISSEYTIIQTNLMASYPEAISFEYATIQNNLGAAYLDLRIGDRAANLTQAIACCREALRFWTPERSPLDYAMVQHNLGGAYGDLPTGDRASNLAQAIHRYQEALRFWTPEVAPLGYAMTQNNLGAAYHNLPTGDRASNLAQAIQCYQEALRFRTPEAAPLDYAMTQNNLGNAYGDLSTGDRASNLAQAIQCYQKALRFWTVETVPFGYRMVNRNLAELYFVQREWEAAFAAFHNAIAAGEQIYRAGLSSESKAAEVAQNAIVYNRATFSAVRSGKTIEALLILERGKTQLLDEALRLQVPRPANVPDEVWEAYEQAKRDIRIAQSERVVDNISFLPSPPRIHAADKTNGITQHARISVHVIPSEWRTVSDKSQGLVQTYKARQELSHESIAALDAATEHIRTFAPYFLKEIDLRTIRTLLPDEQTVLVAFCITDQGSVGFVVSHDQHVQVVEVPNFTETELKRLLVQFDIDGNPSAGWLVAYLCHLMEYRERSEVSQTALEAWKETITVTLAELGQRLLNPVLSALPPSCKRIIFLPSSGLFLLPLQAVPLSDSSEGRVCDCYEVIYAPSMKVLVDIRAKATCKVTTELYAVINPERENDARLVLTRAEGTAIAQLFEKYTIDEGQVGTKQRVIDRVRGKSYVHFSCRGSYDWENPSASCLYLADGHLSLADLQHGEIDLSAARLVTLSACETGITDVMKGSAEEYMGIPAGFLLAGVPCVISSLWSVPDLSTALLMERFYRNHLTCGMDLAEALREAQKWLRELSIGEVAQYAKHWYRQARWKEKAELFRCMRYYRHQAERDPTLRPFAHPYYWAAFTCNGTREGDEYTDHSDLACYQKE